MVQRKRTAGSAAKRKSSGPQKSSEPPESDVHNADNAAAAVPADLGSQVEQPVTSSLPRKRAKTTYPTPKTNGGQDATLKDGSMDHAPGSHNALLESDTIVVARNPVVDNPKTQQMVDSKSAGEQEGSPPDTVMRDQSPTDEVSHKLGDVDIETPRKRIQPTPVARSTRSTRSRPNDADVEMADELAAMASTEPRRSGRSRKPNTTYDEDKYLDAAQKSLEQPKPQKAPPKAKAGGKAAKSGVWSAQHLLTSKRSKIINAECNAIFNESTWGLFSEEEKQELLSLLHPIDKEITDPDQDPAAPPPRIPSPLLWQNLNNDAFRSAFAELQDDLSTGAYEPSYVKKAEEAMRLRLGSMADAVDDMKNKEFEEYWGQKQAVFFGDAGLSANVTLYELCQHKMLKPGDVFEYKRAFQKGLTVEKVCELCKIDLVEESAGVRKKKDACTLTFRYPAGTNKFLSAKRDGDNDVDAMGESSSGENQDGAKDVSIQVNSLAQLEVAILDEDGTVKASDPEKYKQYPNSNAWKQFMVRRNDEFLGSTFMIRQHYFEKIAAKR